MMAALVLPLVLSSTPTAARREDVREQTRDRWRGRWRDGDSADGEDADGDDADVRRHGRLRMYVRRTLAVEVRRAVRVRSKLSQDRLRNTSRLSYCVEPNKGSDAYVYVVAPHAWRDDAVFAFVAVKARPCSEAIANDCVPADALGSYEGSCDSALAETAITCGVSALVRAGVCPHFVTVLEHGRGEADPGGTVHARLSADESEHSGLLPWQYLALEYLPADMDERSHGGDVECEVLQCLWALVCGRAAFAMNHLDVRESNIRARPWDVLGCVRHVHYALRLATGETCEFFVPAVAFGGRVLKMCDFGHARADVGGAGPIYARALAESTNRCDYLRFYLHGAPGDAAPDAICAAAQMATDSADSMSESTSASTTSATTTGSTSMGDVRDRKGFLPHDPTRRARAAEALEHLYTSDVSVLDGHQLADVFMRMREPNLMYAADDVRAALARMFELAMTPTDALLAMRTYTTRPRDYDPNLSLHYTCDSLSGTGAKAFEGARAWCEQPVGARVPPDDGFAMFYE